METFNLIADAFASVLQLTPILMMAGGTLIGIVVGATPGLSSGMAVAVLLPLTFTMSPLNGIIFLVSIYISVTYGGAITAILLNTPGAPENTATAIDGFQLTRQGRAAEALGAAIASSALGGLFSYIVMLGSIGFVAAIALKFGPPELFLIALSGVAILGAVGSASMVKTIASGAFGLLIGTIGIIPTGEWRATFGSPYLAEGVQVIPILIGMFVVSELMLLSFRDYVIDSEITVKRSLTDIWKAFARPLQAPGMLARSSVLGMVIGLIPAAGATLAAFASYSLSRKLSRKPQEYGHGSLEGVIAAESANNACSGGAIMTTLVLGIPGSVTTAVLLGALTMHGLQAGPSFLAQQGDLVYGIIAAAIVSQLLMTVAAVVGAYGLSGTLSIPSRYLIPVLMLFSIVGAFALRNAAFDVFLMLGAGAFGYLLKRTGYSPAAVVMGVILASIADNELIRMFQLYGEDWYLSFFHRPFAASILALFVATFAWSIGSRLRGPRRPATEPGPIGD